MRVLVATPKMRGKRYPLAHDSAMDLEWPSRLDYLALVGGDDPGAPYKNITDKYNAAREAALGGEYDALLTLDWDMIVPPDALTKLAGLDTDVAYGLYVMGREFPVWNAYHELDAITGLSLSKQRAKAEEAWGRAVEVKGIGHGCTLVRRHVLEALEWRLDDRLDLCSDWWFGLDCFAKGFVQVCDTTVLCGHIRNDVVLWPDVTMWNCYRKAALPETGAYAAAFAAETLEGLEYDKGREQVGIYIE